MGNQMFQYAFGKALEESGTRAGQPLEVLFDVTAYTNPLKKDTRRPYLLEHLNTEAHLASDATAMEARNPHGLVSKVFRRITQKLGIGNIVAYDPALLTKPYRRYYEGYWQSEKYFLPIRERIRREFTLREPLGDAARTMYERIASDPSSVSIFYRRTDYVGSKTFDIGEQDYQRRAIARMRESVPDMTLYVMSDDISWVREHADLPANSVFVSAAEIPPHEEMHLASACRQHIIPNSTFAWWGAWLDDRPQKIVIAPKEWVRGNTREYRDIVPEDWIRV